LSGISDEVVTWPSEALGPDKLGDIFSENVGPWCVCCDFNTGGNVTEIALPILMLHENVLDVDAAISIFSAVDAEIMETHYCVDYG
jgi:hypothetical protein